MRSAATATALGITLTLAALASCAGSEHPVDPPDPQPSSTPVFASEEEALAAAEELYGEYVGAENLLGQGGWTDLTLVEPFVRGQALKDESETAEDLSSKGYKQVGTVSFDSMVIQQLEDGGQGAFAVYLYLCLDFSSADVVDQLGASIVPDDRADRLSMEIAIDDQDEGLKIARSDAWSGASFC